MHTLEIVDTSDVQGLTGFAINSIHIDDYFV